MACLKYIWCVEMWINNIFFSKQIKLRTSGQSVLATSKDRVPYIQMTKLALETAMVLNQAEMASNDRNIMENMNRNKDHRYSGESRNPIQGI